MTKSKISEKIEVTKLTLNVKGQKLNITVDDAKELYEALGKLFEKHVNYYPYYPYWYKYDGTNWIVYKDCQTVSNKVDVSATDGVVYTINNDDCISIYWGNNDVRGEFSN